ncbi:MAG TPA: nitrite reductase small subunit NirD [Gammaproteobacteria bacterium]|nr:nitrite reductase small subunit NirD [Gammaproteobacteria bacterium]
MAGAHSQQQQSAAAELAARTETEGLRWIEAGALEDIPQLGARVLRLPQGDVAIFRNRQNEVFALRDRCPHRGGPLSQGIVCGRTVACPLHGWVIGLNDGQAQGPDEGQVLGYPVEVRDGRVFLGLEDS